MKMSLNYFIEKINPLTNYLGGLYRRVREDEGDIYLVLLVVIVGLLGFGLGRLSVLEEQKIPVIIEDSGVTATIGQPQAVAGVHSGAYVASKSGKAFYAPWCSGVKRIKEENKVWFDNKEAALAAGYAPAAGCLGI